MGGSSGGGSTTQTTEPWDKQRPFLEKGFEQAENIYDQGPNQYYPGETFVDFSNATKAGLAGAEQRALYGSPITDNASNYTANVLGGQSDNPYAPLLGGGAVGLGQTASGANLTGNPYLDATYDQAANKLTQNFENTVLPGIASQFGTAGGAGGSTHQLALGEASGELTDSLASLGADIYGSNYAQERDRQVNAQNALMTAGQGLYDTAVNERLNLVSQSPLLAEAEYQDYDKLLQIGGEYESFAERALEDDINRFNYQQNQDLSTLEDYMRIIQGNYGGTSVTTQQGGGNGLATGIGAASLLSSFF